MDSEDNIKTEEQPRGFLDRVRSATPAIITDNAPKVVSALKILGCTSMLFSKNKIFSVAGAGAITAHAIPGIFASKKTEEEKERLRQEEEAKQSEPQNAVARHLYKFVNPSKYPIESGATLAAASSVLWATSGVVGKGGFSPGRLIAGILSFAADANVAVKKEHIGEMGANPHEKGSKDYYITEMKNRPVLLSSILNIACDTALITGGAYEKFVQKREGNTLWSGLFLLSANVFQAIFVNKNDYNIERKAAAPENGLEKRIAKPAPEAKKQTAWQERLETQSAQSNLAMQL